MQKAPLINEIKDWLRKENPLNFFKDDFSIEDIDPKPWSGHFNYLIKAPKNKFILRFKGPEWGETKGVADEYKILKKIEDYKVGPKVFYFTKNFFGEPMIFEEFLNGKLLTEFPEKDQEVYFKDVAKLICKINSITFGKNEFPFQEPMINFERNKNTWQKRINIITNNNSTEQIGNELLQLLPQLEFILDKFGNLLSNTIENSGDVFIFESAHIGHLINTSQGFRFLNWEQVSYGDPSYTLAVFLVSVSKHKHFEKIKKL